MRQMRKTISSISIGVSQKATQRCRPILRPEAKQDV